MKIRRILTPSVLLVALLSVIFISCQSGEYDTRAIESLDKLTEAVGNLSSASYTLDTFIIKEDSTEVSKQSDVYLRGPNKMYIHMVEGTEERGLWYNGKEFAYYAYHKMQYDTIAAPENILLAIDFIHEKYGIDFPSADFLYPSLTDDLMTDYTSILYGEEEVIDGIPCILIEAFNENEILQIWIVKETNLPFRMIIDSKTRQDRYYETTYTNWRSNPDLPDIMFEFDPPSNSTREPLLNKN